MYCGSDIDFVDINKNTYNRKSFVHTGSFESAKTSSFTAVTASAPTGLTATSEEDFMFFINGMLIENDALTINQKTSTNLELRLDTNSLGYILESSDESSEINEDDIRDRSELLKNSLSNFSFASL